MSNATSKQNSSIHLSYDEWFAITGLKVEGCTKVEISLERVAEVFYLDFRNDFPVCLRFYGPNPVISILGRDYVSTRLLWKMTFEELFQLWEKYRETNSLVAPLEKDFVYMECFDVKTALYQESSGASRKLCRGHAEYENIVEVMGGLKPNNGWERIKFMHEDQKEEYTRACTYCMTNARNSH